MGPWLGLRALALLAALIVVVPTASTLAGRIAVHGAVLLAWGPLISWIPAGVAPFGRPVAALTVFTGVVTAWLAGTRRPLRAVLPRLHAVDVLLPVAGGVAAWTAGPLLTVTSPTSALRMLMLGWDNASHFTMFYQQRFTATAPPFLAPPADGSRWYFDTYPQLYHSLLASLTGLVYGPAAGSPQQELLRYAHVTGAVFVAVTVIVVAALLALPQVRRSGTAAAAAAAVSVSVLAGCPGAQLLVDGHLSFIVACAAVIVIPVLAAQGAAPSPLLRIAAVAGLLAATASWLLLLPAAVAAACWPLSADLRTLRDRKALLAAASVFLVAAAALVCYIASVFLGAPAGAATLDKSGGSVTPTTLSLIITIAAAVAVGLAACEKARGSGRRRSVTGPLYLGLAVTCGISLAALYLYQKQSAGVVSYYFFKLGAGLQLVLIVTAVPVLADLAALRPSRALPPGRRGAGRVVAAVAVTAASAVGLGYVVSDISDSFVAPAYGWMTTSHRQLSEAARTGRSSSAEHLLAAAAVVSQGTAFRTTYVAGRADDLDNPGLTNFWFHAMTASVTSNTFGSTGALGRTGTRPGQPSPAGAIAGLLSAKADALVVTDIQVPPEVAGRYVGTARLRVMP